MIDTGPHRGDIPSPLQYKASIRPLPLAESLKLQDELIDADIKYGNFAFCHPFTNTLNILFLHAASNGTYQGWFLLFIVIF